MNFSRKMDNLCHSLASIQARIFERSVEKGVPSYFFIKSYMLLDEVREIDYLNLESSGITEQELFEKIKSNIRINRGIVLPYSVMRFVGYFYRSASYMCNLSSKFLYKNIPPKFLISSFDTLHALPIEEAIKNVFEVLKIRILTNEEKFINIYKSFK